MYLPLGESSEKLRVNRAGVRGLLGFVCLALAGFVGFGGTLTANAACSNPSPMPSGYASPCPVFSVSPASVSQFQSLALSATPQAGTDYIYITAYYSEGSGWTPLTLTGNNAAPSYSSGTATGSIGPSILSTLTPSTRYVVLWDWLWDATAQCYKGPGLNQCNTGTWRLQTFVLTAGTTYTYSQSAYGTYTYSQSAYTTGSCAGPWSVTNPMPASCVFYSQNPNSVTTKRLPADVMNHLATGGDTMAKCALTDCGQVPVTSSYQTWATPGSDDFGIPLYYATAADPYYKLPGCLYTGSTAMSSLPPFHAPNNVPFTDTWRTDSKSGGADGNVRIWDQATGAIVGDYDAQGSTSPFRIGVSAATTPGAAVSMNTGTGCGAAKNALTDQDWGLPYGWKQTQGAEGSSLLAPMAGVVRSKEMISGAINHALVLGLSCIGSYNGATHVFPSGADTGICSQLGSSAAMPPNGALLFLDYTDTEINSMNLPGWQKAIITAMSHYGGYADVTCGGCPAQLHYYHESGLPYQLKTGGTLTTRTGTTGATGMYISGGTPDPVFALLASQGVACSRGSGSGDCKYSQTPWANIPSIRGADVNGHIHMADPCIAKGYANQSGGCP